MSDELNELMSLLKNSLAYAPIAYNQATYNTNEYNQGFEYVVDYKMPSFPEDCLLFMTPVYSSRKKESDEDTRSHKLIIRTPEVINGVTQYSHTLEYDIVVETLEDSVPYRQATVGDIIANRMCIFRFLRGYPKAILTNSPLFNEARYSSIKATNAEFFSKPIIKRTDENNTPLPDVQIATEDEITELNERLSSWENKITFGTEPPEVALAESPVGTLYIQLEED